MMIINSWSHALPHHNQRPLFHSPRILSVVKGFLPQNIIFTNMDNSIPTNINTSIVVGITPPSILEVGNNEEQISSQSISGDIHDNSTLLINSVSSPLSTIKNTSNSKETQNNCNESPIHPKETSNNCNESPTSVSGCKAIVDDENLNSTNGNIAPDNNNSIKENPNIPSYLLSFNGIKDRERDLLWYQWIEKIDHTAVKLTEDGKKIESIWWFRVKKYYKHGYVKEDLQENINFLVKEQPVTENL